MVATVSIGAFLGQLDAPIVTLALPTLQQHFHASLGAVEWVALSYLLMLVATVTAVGRLADMIGRKLLHTYGFGVFTHASIGCGLAPNLAVLIGFRVVQAVGAAMLQANSVTLIATAIPTSSLGRAIGIQGGAQAVDLALGPSVGGLLSGVADWRWIFPEWPGRVDQHDPRVVSATTITQPRAPPASTGPGWRCSGRPSWRSCSLSTSRAASA